MSKLIQLRHVPDTLHRQLKARAAIEGMSLSDFLIREARKIAERPTMKEIRNRLAAQAPTQLKTSAVPLLSRMWQLRTSVTPCDAAYLALAEGLPARLLTCDSKLSRAHGHRARVELLA